MAEHIESYSAEQLEALAAKKRRAEQADVIDFAEERFSEPADAWPTETTVSGHTFHLQPDLRKDWDFSSIILNFERIRKSGEGNIDEAAKQLISYAYVEPYDEIMDVLLTLHPEDERPYRHMDDVTALINGAFPKAR